MKKYFFFPLLALLVIMSGCESQQSIQQESQDNTPSEEQTQDHGSYGFNFDEPALTVAVMKLAKPEYKYCALASLTSEYPDYYVGDRGNQCEEAIGKTGYYPYWELPDNWLLVDWKWRLFPYIENIVLTEQTWDKYTWSHDFTPQWPLSEPHEVNPITQVLLINIANLENYRKAKYGEGFARYIEKTKLDFCYAGNECLCEISDKMDSIWAVLQTDLSVAVKNGDLEKLQ